MAITDNTDKEVELQDLPFDSVPTGLFLEVTTSSNDKTFFTDATIEGPGHDGQPLGQDKVLNKTIRVPIVVGPAYVVRVTIAFTGKEDEAEATVNVDGKIVDAQNQTLDTRFAIFRGRREKVARARFRVGVQP